MSRKLAFYAIGLTAFGAGFLLRTAGLSFAWFGLLALPLTALLWWLTGIEE